jgi:hypothetical protein
MVTQIVDHAARAVLELPGAYRREASPIIKAIVDAVGEEIQEAEDATADTAQAWLLENAIGHRLRSIALRVGQEIVTDDIELLRILILARDRANKSRAIPKDFREVLNLLGLDWFGRYDDPGAVVFQGWPHSEISTEIILGMLKDSAHMGVNVIAEMRTDDIGVSLPLTFSSVTDDARILFDGAIFESVSSSTGSLLIAACEMAIVFALYDSGDSVDFVYGGSSIGTRETKAGPFGTVLAVWHLQDVDGIKTLGPIGDASTVAVVRCSEQVEVEPTDIEINANYDTEITDPISLSAATTEGFVRCRISIARTDLGTLAAPKKPAGSGRRDFEGDSAKVAICVNEKQAWGETGDPWARSAVAGLDHFVYFAIPVRVLSTPGGFSFVDGKGPSSIISKGLLGIGGLCVNAVRHAAPTAVQSPWASVIEEPSGLWSSRRVESYPKLGERVVTRIPDLIGGHDLINPGENGNEPRIGNWKSGIQGVFFDGDGDYLFADGAGDPYSGDGPMVFVCAFRILSPPTDYSATAFAFANESPIPPSDWQAWQGVQFRDAALRVWLARSDDAAAIDSATIYDQDLISQIVVSGEVRSGYAKIWAETILGEHSAEAAALTAGEATIPNLAVGALRRASASSFGSIVFGSLVVGRAFANRRAAVEMLKKEFPIVY